MLLTDAQQAVTLSVVCGQKAQRGQRGQGTWMKTTGTALFAVNRYSLARMRVAAQGERSAPKWVAALIRQNAGELSLVI
jgi:hypothetical protein